MKRAYAVLHHIVKTPLQVLRQVDGFCLLLKVRVLFIFYVRSGASCCAFLRSPSAICLVQADKAGQSRTKQRCSEVEHPYVVYMEGGCLTGLAVQLADVVSGVSPAQRRPMLINT